MNTSQSYTPSDLEKLDPAELRDLLNYFGLNARRPRSNRGWMTLQKHVSMAQARERRVALPTQTTKSIEDYLG